MVNKTDYAGEFVQSLLVGSILAVAIFAIITFGNVDIGLPENFVIILVMFIVGVFSSWWAMYKLKGRSFLGTGSY